VSDCLKYRKHLLWALVPIANGELQRTGPREVAEAAESSPYDLRLQKADSPYERLVALEYCWIVQPLWALTAWANIRTAS